MLRRSGGVDKSGRLKGMDSDPRIPIRETLATAVKLVGGSLVDDLLSNVANRPKNADYVFPQDSAIGELKCLEQDSTDWFTEKLHVLYDGWVAQGRVPALRAATVRIHLRDCQRIARTKL